MQASSLLKAAAAAVVCVAAAGGAVALGRLTLPIYLIHVLWLAVIVAAIATSTSRRWLHRVECTRSCLRARRRS